MSSAEGARTCATIFASISSSWARMVMDHGFDAGAPVGHGQLQPLAFGQQHHQARKQRCESLLLPVGHPTAPGLSRVQYMASFDSRRLPDTARRCCASGKRRAAARSGAGWEQEGGGRKSNHPAVRPENRLQPAVHQHRLWKARHRDGAVVPAACSPGSWRSDLCARSRWSAAFIVPCRSSLSRSHSGPASA